MGCGELKGNARSDALWEVHEASCSLVYQKAQDMLETDAVRAALRARACPENSVQQSEEAA